MSRYRGPKLKIIRRLGELPAFSTKRSKKRNPPGQHGQKLKKFSPYAIRLMEKQKLRYNYGIGEKQLFNYLKIARQNQKSTTEVLLSLLEMRLDSVLFRSGATNTIDEAKQLINHKHIAVNERKISIPSYKCKIGDQISILTTTHVCDWGKNPQPSFLEINTQDKMIHIKSSINRQELLLKVNELLIIEYYSKN